MLITGFPYHLFVFIIFYKVSIRIWKKFRILYFKQVKKCTFALNLANSEIWQDEKIKKTQASIC